MAITLTRTGSQVFKDFVGGNGPTQRATGAWRVRKAEARVLLTEYETAMNAADAAITTINTELATHTTQINTLITEVAAIDISGINTAITNIENDIDTINTEIAALVSNDKQFGINVTSQGAVAGGSSGTNAPAFEDAVDLAETEGHEQVYVPKGNFDITGYDQQTRQATFVGPGKLIHPSMQLRTESLRHQAMPGFNNVNPAIHLPRFLAAANPVVVVVGDSTMTTAASSLTERDTIEGLIYRRLCEDNPGKDITYINRAVGGTTWGALATHPASDPGSWYTGYPNAWLANYIEPLEPDLVIIGMGMNDKQTIDVDAMLAVFGIIEGWTKIPDILVCTNLVPTAITDDSSYSTADEQNGRDAAAGLLRTMAQIRGYGILDFHRAGRCLRDGWDPCDSTLKEVLLTAATTMPWTANALFAGYDYCWEATFASVPADFWDRAGDDSAPIDIPLSAITGNRVQMRRNGSGNVQLKVYQGPGSLFTTVDSNQPAPTSGTIIIKVELDGPMLRIRVNQNQCFYGLVPRCGDMVVPTLKYFNRGDLTQAFTVSLWVGEPMMYNKRLSNSDLWDTYDGSSATKKPYGGNGINHPTTFARFVYEWVLQNTQLGGGALTKVDGGYYIGLGKSGAVANTDADDFVIEGTSSGGMSLLVQAGGVARIKSGPPGGEANQAITFDHGNTRVAIHAGAAARLHVLADGTTRPAVSTTQSLGDSSHLWADVWASDATINTSDANDKYLRAGPTDAVLRAWGNVRPTVFQWISAVDKKGEEGARYHIGFVAQTIEAAFVAQGEDAHRWGLFCEDDEVEERTTVTNVVKERIREYNLVPVLGDDGQQLMGHLDDSGTTYPRMRPEPVMEEYNEPVETTEVVKTGAKKLSLRLTECLAMEAAWQRKRGDLLETRLAALETRVYALAPT